MGKKKSKKRKHDVNNTFIGKYSDDNDSYPQRDTIRNVLDASTSGVILDNEKEEKED